jgi:MoxR-like ATPase
MEGTYPLPEAQLDRFFCKILVRFPTADELLGILDRTTTAAQPKVETTFPSAKILELGALAREVPVVEEISRFAINLVLGTHPDSPQASTLVRQYVRFGASPRGAQALMLGAKIRAILDGRFNVSREELIAVAPVVLRPRRILYFEGQAESIATDDVIQSLLK